MAPAEDCFAPLPDEVLASIIERVGEMDNLGNCFLVCKRWGGMANALSRLQIDLTGAEAEPYDSDPYELTSSWKSFQWDVFRAIFSNRQLLSRLFIKLPGTFTTRQVNDLHAIVLGSACLPACIALITCGLKKFKLAGNVSDELNTYPSCKAVLGALLTSQTRSTLEELELENLAFSIPAEVIPSSTSTLPRLTYCRLYGIQMGDDDLSKLLELSPNLVQLRLKYCTGLASPTISSQSLRLLTFFWQSWNLKQPDPRAAMSKLLVVNAPKLKRLELLSVKEVELQATARSMEMLALYSPTVVTFRFGFSTRVEQLLLWFLPEHRHLWTEEGLASTMSGFAAEEVQSVSIDAPLAGTSILRPSHFFQGCQELTLGKHAYQCCRRVHIGSLKKIILVDIDKIKVGWFLGLEKRCQSLVDIVLAMGDGKRDISFTQKVLHLQQRLSRAKLTLIQVDQTYLARRFVFKKNLTHLWRRVSSYHCD